MTDLLDLQPVPGLDDDADYADVIVPGLTTPSPKPAPAVVPTSGALTVSSLMARSQLTADETRAVVDAMGSINEYLAQAKEFARAGLSLADYLQSELSNNVGVWPAAVAEACLETSLPDALAAAAVKLDDVIRAHHPRLTATGLQRL